MEKSHIQDTVPQLPQQGLNLIHVETETKSSKFRESLT